MAANSEDYRPCQNIMSFVDQVEGVSLRQAMPPWPKMAAMAFANMLSEMCSERNIK